MCRETLNGAKIRLLLCTVSYDRQSVRLYTSSTYKNWKTREAVVLERLRWEIPVFDLFIAFICKLAEIIKMILQHLKKICFINHCNDATCCWGLLQSINKKPWRQLAWLQAAGNDLRYIPEKHFNYSFPMSPLQDEKDKKKDSESVKKREKKLLREFLTVLLQQFYRMIIQTGAECFTVIHINNYTCLRQK